MKGERQTLQCRAKGKVLRRHKTLELFEGMLSLQAASAIFEVRLLLNYACPGPAAHLCEAPDALRAEINSEVEMSMLHPRVIDVRDGGVVLRGFLLRLAAHGWRERSLRCADDTNCLGS